MLIKKHKVRVVNERSFVRWELEEAELSQLLSLGLSAVTYTATRKKKKRSFLGRKEVR